MVKLLGGEISVRSEVGVGTCFTINFQFKYSDKKIKDEKTEKSLDSDFANKYPLKILVADDNLINREVANGVFKKLGFQIKLVENGIEVLETIKFEYYDLILMDLHMPEMDGFEATKEIIALLGANRPKIIAFTADLIDTSKDIVFETGFDDLMFKPLKLEELESKLVSIYKQKKN